MSIKHDKETRSTIPSSIHLDAVEIVEEMSNHTKLESRRSRVRNAQLNLTKLERRQSSKNRPTKV